MNDFTTEMRKRVIFPENGSSFVRNCIQVREEIKKSSQTNNNMAELYANTAADLAIDLRSFLINWKLASFVREGSIVPGDIEAQSDAFLALASELGCKKIDAARAEIESIEKSSVKKMTEMWLDGKLSTYWGHDYASGIIHSLRRGACFSTNNPCKNTLFKKDFPAEYQAILEDIMRENPELPLEDKVSLIMIKICSINAKQLRPIFEATDGKYGFICIQTNPFNIPNDDSTEKIIKQIEFFDAAFKRELNTDKPNVVYKIPAVEKGIKAAEYLTKHGYRLCVTLNFTVTQHEEFAKIISESGVPGFVVLMGGLLDDKVAADLKALGIENAVEIGRHAAQAVIRKSYSNLHAKGYDKNVSIMTAAVRGPWAIANTLAPAGGAQSAITTLTAKIEEFDNAPLPLVSKLDTPVDTDIMNTLMKSKVFRMAYATPSEQKWDWNNLFEFPPFMAFYDQFREAYATLTQDMSDISEKH